jgi:hypothetical protein
MGAKNKKTGAIQKAKLTEEEKQERAQKTDPIYRNRAMGTTGKNPENHSK